MDSNGYVGVSWGATDIYTRNGQLSGTGYDSRFVGWLRSHNLVIGATVHVSLYKLPGRALAYLIVLVMAVALR